MTPRATAGKAITAVEGRCCLDAVWGLQGPYYSEYSHAQKGAGIVDFAFEYWERAKGLASHLDSPFGRNCLGAAHLVGEKGRWGF